MAEGQIFDIPMLEMEEIMTCVHERMLGDMAANILPEHLKTPTPAVMMQLCLSILSKLGVEVGTLCQARLNSSMELKHPDTYINTFKLVHVSMLMQKFIPMLGNTITLTDLTTPRWKKVRKFICACINYFKSWDGNVKVWDEKYSPSAAAEDEYRRLKDMEAANEKEISDLKAYFESHKAEHKDLNEKFTKAQQEVQECHKRKEEKELVKAGVKKSFSEVTMSLDKMQKHLDALNAEKENLLAQVVESPKRHTEGKHAASQKMKVWEEKQTEAQRNVREEERVISVMHTMGQLVGDSVRTAKENKSIREDMSKIATEKQTQSYEIENQRLAIVEDTQGSTNLKQQIVASREKISRMALRSKQRTTEFNSVMGDLEREKGELESQAGEIHDEIIKEEAEIRSLRNQCEIMETEQKKFVDDIAAKKQKLMTEMDKYITRAENKINESQIKTHISGFLAHEENDAAQQD